MRIAVIGAGIGRLVVAAGLQRDGHDIVVYGQRSEPSPDGTGSTLFANAFIALDALGLGGTVRRCVQRYRRLHACGAAKSFGFVADHCSFRSGK